MKTIRFAFALDEKNMFSEKYFSEAPKYDIYEYSMLTNEINLVLTISNSSLSISNTEQKMDVLFNTLKKHNVEMIVAKTFSPVLKTENKFFVPIVIVKNTPEEICQSIVKHIKWLSEEINVLKTEHMFFKIDHGIYKYKTENN